MNGNGLDQSGNSNNATVSTIGVYPMHDRLGFEQAALFFNGNLEQCSLSTGTSLLNNLSAGSISFWYRLGINPTNNVSLVGQDNLWEIGYNGSSPRRLLVNHPTHGTVTQNITTAVSDWVHVTVTRTSTRQRIYINGTLTQTNNANYSMATSTFPFNIGGRVLNQTTDNFFPGTVDEVRVYSRELTQDEVNVLSSSLSLMYTVTSVSTTNLCAGAALNIGFSATGTPQSGNVFTAQLSDENGAFNTPYILGTLSGATGGIINATIPGNIPTGNGYKVRIVGSIPPFVGGVSIQTLTVNNASDSWSTLSRGRILWYKFDANPADSSGNGLNASLVGGTSYTTDRFGNPTGALQLNGTTGHAVAPQGVYFDGSPYTVSCWVRPVAYNNWSRVYDFGRGQANDNVLAVISQTTTGRVAAENYNAGSGARIDALNGMPLNQWSHMLVRYNGSHLEVYINGNLVVTGATNMPRLLTRTLCYIGRSNWAADAYANAAFDDFMIYNRALNEDEIKSLASDGVVHYNRTPCVNSVLALGGPQIQGATYSWSGPNGFTSSNLFNTILNASAANSGNYTLTITRPPCAAFSQTTAITVANPGSQPTVNFTGLPDTTFVGRPNSTLTGIPANWVFTGPGIENVNQFNPTLAGVGTHTIFYQVTGAGGCITSLSRQVVVLPGFAMQNGTITSCQGSFYDAGLGTANYGPNENFTQTFCSGNSDKLRFTFTQMSLGAGDTLWAFDGNSTSGKLLGMFIQNSRPDIIWSDGSCITFRFTSNATNQAAGWTSTFQCLANPAIARNFSLGAGISVVCEGKVYDPAGTGNYGYGYNVQTFKSRNGERLQMNVFEFNINFNNGGHWLRVYDGPSTAFPSLGQFNSCCAPPTIFTSTGEFLTVEFDANNTNAGVGSRAGFGMDISCFGTALSEFLISDSSVVNTCSGVFYDNGGPNNNYNNNATFEKTFCSDNGQLLRFDFTRNATQFGAGDTLWAYDGNSSQAPLLGIYIAGSEINPVKSSGTCLTFRFFSNNTGTSQGWQSLISCVATQSQQDTIFTTSGLRTTCNAIVEDDSKEFAYGQGYNVQTYKSRNGERLRFQRTLFQINGNNGGHWLNIYDGPSTAFPLIGAYNNFNFLPASIESTGEYLTFEFDRTNTAAGFGSQQGYRGLLTCTTPALPVFAIKDTIQNVCEGVFTDDGGLNQNYSNNYSAIHTFCSANGQQLQISFNVNNTQFGTGDTLWAYDGPNTNAPPLATYFQGSRIETLTSSGTCLTFRFTSNASSTGRGWQGIIRCVNTPPPLATYVMSSGTRNVCSGSFLDAGGTGNYSVGTGQTFVQTFTSYSGERLRATRNSFSVNGNNGGHWLDVYDGPSISSPLIGSYNNFNFPPAAWQSTGSSLTFRFRGTNTAAGSAAGWDISFSCFTGSPIDVSVLSSPVCQGSSISIPFTLNDTVGTGNVYSVQLSDSTGNFAGAVTIGSLSSAASSGTINATIPTNRPAASGYRIRVNSSVPVQLGSQSPNPITILAIPVQPATISVSGSTNFCNGIGSATLSIPNQPGMNYRWLRNDSVEVGNNSRFYTATEPGVYRVELSGACDTLLSMASVTINAIAAPVAPSITAGGPTSFCSGGSVQLSISPQTGMSYQWRRGTTNVGTNSPTFAASVAGNYSVRVSNACGLVTSLDTVVVTITGSAPTAPTITAGGATTFCTGDSVLLSIPAQTGAAYQWSRGGVNVGSNSNTFVANQAGTYTVTITNSCGSANAVNSIAVTVNAPPTVPTITAGGPTTFCTGGSVQLSVPAQAGVAYQWRQGSANIGTNNNTFTATTAGVYSIRLTNSCGVAFSTDSVTVTISGTLPAAPTISSTGALTFCAGDSVLLSVPVVTGVSYQWRQGTTPVGSNSNQFYAKQSGSYTVMLNNICGNVTSTNAVAVNVNNLPTTPTIQAGGATTFCPGQSVILSAPSGFSSYIWSNGQTNNSITVSTSGMFTVRVVNASGCTSAVSAPVTTTLASPPAAPLVVSAPTICSGQSATAQVSGSGTITWFANPSGGLSIGTGTTYNTGTLNLTTTFYAEASQGSCISPRTAVTVTVRPSPVATVGTVVNNLCNGNSTGSISVIVGSGTAPFSFLWSNGAITQNISNLLAGSYSLTVTDSNGCQTTLSNVSVTQPAQINIAGNVTNAGCAGQSNGAITLNVTGGVAPYTFSWSHGPTTSGVSNLATGSYTVTVTDANNCVRISSPFNVSPQAPVTVTPTVSSPLCFGGNGSINLSISGASGPITYLWSNNATSQNLTNVPAGSYSVTIINQGCTTQAGPYVINQPAQLSATAQITNFNPPNQQGSIVLTILGGTAPFTYLWSHGPTSKDVFNLFPGFYTVTITDANGCTFQQTYQVDFGLGLPNTQTPVELELYPNPASSYIWITLPKNTETLLVQISDVRGVVVFERTVMPQEFLEPIKLPIFNLSQGLYFVQVKGVSIYHSRKLEVVR
jgi:hypothetical protein